jgi:hypothetical protein
MPGRIRQLFALAAFVLVACNNAPCPEVAPLAHWPCVNPVAPEPLVCEYGGDEWGNCTITVSCFDGADGAPDAGTGWLYDIAESPERSTCDLATIGCPASFDLDGGGAPDCTDTASTACEYGSQGECGCGAGEWSCRAWSSAGAGCPVHRPRLGSKCSIESQACDYGNCCGIGVTLGPSMICQSGIWVFVDAECNCPAEG